MKLGAQVVFSFQFLSLQRKAYGGAEAAGPGTAAPPCLAQRSGTGRADPNARGTTDLRSFALGASAPWKRMRCSRSRGTRAARRSSLEHGTALAETLAAETFPVSVEDDYVVVEA